VEVFNLIIEGHFNGNRVRFLQVNLDIRIFYGISSRELTRVGEVLG